MQGGRVVPRAQRKTGHLTRAWIISRFWPSCGLKVGDCPRSSLLEPGEAGVGERALQEFGAAGVVFGEVAAVERIEYVLHGDVAGELRDAVRHALVIAHREVGGKTGVQARAIRRADDDRDMSAAEDRQDVLEVGGKAAVGDNDCRMVGARGKRSRPCLRPRLRPPARTASNRLLRLATTRCPMPWSRPAPARCASATALSTSISTMTAPAPTSAAARTASSPTRRSSSPTVPRAWLNRQDECHRGKALGRARDSSPHLSI